MCRDCQHWQHHEVEELGGLRFARCALRPERIIRDRRRPTGTDIQAYVTQDSYACDSYTQKK